MQDYDAFKVGDIVWCTCQGKGTVIGLSEYSSTYSVKVKFSSRTLNYTRDGRIFSDSGSRTLFFSEPKVEGAVKRPFTPTLVGKNIIIDHKLAGTLVLTVESETDKFIHSAFGLDYQKSLINTIYEVGDKLL